MSVTITTDGARQIERRFENFPTALHEKLKERIGVALAELWEGVESEVPHRTGRLASEIRSRLFSDARYRVAGYVSVYTPSPGPAPHNEYAKAAALEYGSWSRLDAASGVVTRILGNNRRAKKRMAGAHKVNEYRYLRGPLDALRPEILAGMEEAVAETVAENS